MGYGRVDQIPYKQYKKDIEEAESIMSMRFNYLNVSVLQLWVNVSSGQML